MGLRAQPILYTLVPTLVLALGLHVFLADALRLDGFLVWLIAINAAASPLWLLDKLQSKRSGGFRVPERTLHLVSAAGGAAMALAMMHLVRHKTRHRSFWWINLALLVVWAAAVALWLSRS